MHFVFKACWFICNCCCTQHPLVFLFSTSSFSVLLTRVWNQRLQYEQYEEAEQRSLCAHNSSFCFALNHSLIDEATVQSTVLSSSLTKSISRNSSHPDTCWHSLNSESTVGIYAAVLQRLSGKNPTLCRLEGWLPHLQHMHIDFHTYMTNPATPLSRT